MIDYKEQRGVGVEDYVAARQRGRTGETDQIGCGFASGDWGEDLERLERLSEGGFEQGGGGERGNELLNRPAYFIYTKCILRLSLFFPPEVSSRLCIGNAE